MTTPEAPKQTVLLAYAGLRLGKGEKPLSLYYLLDSLKDEAVSEADGKSFAFDATSKSQKKYMMGSVGSVYEVEWDGGTKIYPGSARWRGRWQQRDVTLSWDADHTTTKAHLDGKKGRLKAARGSPLRRQLEPLRKMYQGTSYLHRAQLLATIVEMLTHSAPLTEEEDDDEDDDEVGGTPKSGPPVRG